MYKASLMNLQLLKAMQKQDKFSANIFQILFFVKYDQNVKNLFHSNYFLTKYFLFNLYINFYYLLSYLHFDYQVLNFIKKYLH